MAYIADGSRLRVVNEVDATHLELEPHTAARLADLFVARFGAPAPWVTVAKTPGCARAARVRWRVALDPHFIAVIGVTAGAVARDFAILHELGCLDRPGQGREAEHRADEFAALALRELGCPVDQIVEAVEGFLPAFTEDRDHDSGTARVRQIRGFLSEQ